MSHRSITPIAFIVSVILVAGYVYVYQFSPFSENVNNILIDLADPISSLLAAIAVTAVLMCYRRDDKPYLVWLFFALGTWFWFAAETVYSLISYVSGDVPPLGWADVLWFIGYGLVSLALYHQYQLVQKTQNGLLKLAAIWIGLIVVITPLILLVLRIEFSADNYVAYLYPAMDFAICIVSFRLYMVFGGGKLSRPWIGLLVLGISDALWAALVAYQPDQSSIISDTFYVAAYLILAIGFLRQFLLLRFGPE